MIVSKFDVDLEMNLVIAIFVKHHSCLLVMV